MQTIGEAAALSGVHIETIRYYERTGVLPKPARSEGGRRLYDEAAIRRLQFVRRCRDLGFSLADIRALSALSGTSDACADVQAVGQAHLAAIRTKISDLRKRESALSALIKPCNSGERECPALRTLHAVEFEPAPRGGGVATQRAGRSRATRKP